MIYIGKHFLRLATRFSQAARVPCGTAASSLRREPAEGVRQAANVLDQIGRHLAGAVGAQAQRIDETAKALADRPDDLVVAADPRRTDGRRRPALPAPS